MPLEGFMISNRSLDDALFNNEINDTFREPLRFNNDLVSILKKPNTPTLTYNEIKSSLFESFILNNEVNFKVEGENLALKIMINEIGLRGVEELIDENAFSFTLWTPVILALQHPFAGVPPISATRLRDGPNADPEQSLELAINNLSAPIKRRERRNLIRKLRDNYIAVPEQIEDNCLEEVLSALKSGKLQRLGLNLNGRDINELTQHEKNLLAICTSDLLGYKYVINKHARTSPISDINILFEDSLSKSEALSKEEVFSSIIEFEKFPDLRKSFDLMGQPMDQLLRVRKSKSAKRFRDWLSEINNATTPLEAQQIYVESNLNPKGFFDTFWGKSTKSFSMMFLGYGAGHLISPVIAPYSAAILPFADSLKDYIFDMADEYLLSELTKGWTPQVFINDLKNLKFKYSN
ncbi:TPA: hypothetical protein ACYUTL_002462 [Serratia marcescens]